MDIEELVRIHNNVAQYMQVQLGSICEMLLNEQEIFRLTEFLKEFSTPETGAQLSNMRNPSQKSFMKAYSVSSKKNILDKVRDPKFDPDLSLRAMERLAQLVSYTPYDLDKLRKLPFTRSRDLTREVRMYNPDKEETHYPVVFKSLRLPLYFGERDETLLNTFGRFYGALTERSGESMQAVGDTDAYSLFDKFEEIAGLDPRERAKYSWALLCADDSTKNILSLPALTGDLTPTSQSAGKHIRLLYDKIHDIRSNVRKQEGTIKNQLERIDSMEGTIVRKQREIEELSGKVKSLEENLRKLKDKPSRQDAPADLGEARIYIEKARDEATTWEAIAHETEREKASLTSELEKAKAEMATLEGKLSQLSVKEAKANGGIANSTGITVYAGPEFSKRYSQLYVYMDSSIPNGKTFTDVIDGLIKHLCHRIKEGGKDIALKEFDYMPQVKCHFYKKTDAEARGTRVFFTTDFDSRLTIYDVITPDEHDEKVQSDRGRYKGIMDNRISYTFDERQHVKIERSVRELFGKA